MHADLREEFTMKSEIQLIAHMRGMTLVTHTVIIIFVS